MTDIAPGAVDFVPPAEIGEAEPSRHAAESPRTSRVRPYAFRAAGDDSAAATGSATGRACHGFVNCSASYHEASKPRN